MHALKIPENPEDITPEWLTQMLHHAQAIQKANVVSFNATPIGVGIGFVGRIVRFVLKYDKKENQAPSSVVAKFPSTNPSLQRYWKKPPSLYEIENRFYKHIASQTSLTIPKQYYGEFDHEAQKGVIIIEDLTTLRAGDQVAGCSLSDAKIAIKDMAHFHSDFWESDKLNAISWLASFNQNVEGLHQRYVDGWPAFYKKFGHQLSESVIAINKQVTQHGIAIRNRLATTPQTFVHGDFRLDNVFFDTNAMVVVDWGGYRRGTCMWDVNQFICQSLNINERQQAEESLLQQYHQTLQSRGIEYDWDQFFYDYRSTTVITWVKIVRAMSLNTDINNRAQKLAQIVIERVSTALVDHYSDDLIPS